jgi:hypothetical protein
MHCGAVTNSPLLDRFDDIRHPEASFTKLHFQTIVVTVIHRLLHLSHDLQLPPENFFEGDSVRNVNYQFNSFFIRNRLATL